VVSAFGFPIRQAPTPNPISVVVVVFWLCLLSAPILCLLAASITALLQYRDFSLIFGKHFL
jgi:hypothetical protein